MDTNCFSSKAFRHAMQKAVKCWAILARPSGTKTRTPKRSHE